ncbi:MAG: hypothetical protein WC050_00195 [Candidatus Paceibacterota bacterium]
MGVLKGAHFGEPLSDYLGLDSEVPEKAQIDFRYQLGRLWKQKLERKDKKTGKPVPRSSATLEEIEKMLLPYDVDKVRKMDIAGYRDEIAQSMKEVRASIDLDRIAQIGKFSGFDDDQVRLLKELEKRITPTTILAYALTEIMPTKGAASVRGVQVLDFILRNGGPDFVERIPALYDSMLSFGPYQFTSHALLDVGRVRQGASMMNGITRNKKNILPGSVVKLRGTEHHKAAYCFALYNLAAVVEQFDEKRAQKLLRPDILAALTPSLIAEYIASAHHLPANARRSLRSYADQLIRAHDHPDKKKRFDPYIGHAAAAGVSGYVNKTRDNLAALKKMYGWTL